MKKKKTEHSSNLDPENPAQPKGVKSALETMASVATVLTEAANEDKECPIPNSHLLAYKIMGDAMSGKEKSFATADLQAATMDERKEIAQFFGTMQQFCRQIMSLITTVAIEKEDDFVSRRDEDTGSLWLGEGPIPKDAPPMNEVFQGDQLGDIGDDNMPPEVRAIVEMIKKATGLPVIAMPATKDEVEGFTRLQDEYKDVGDPIRDLVRRLDKMPGGKRPKLDPKKLPEC